MASFFSPKRKDGEQTCAQCGGEGCYWCRKAGTMVLCPACGNTERDLVTGVNELHCEVCGAIFLKDGTLVDCT
jgi:hypothetical protein